MLSRRTCLAGAGTLAAVRAGLAPARAANAPTVKTPVDFAVPADACDCHVHVVGDPARFPLSPTRVYTAPPASPEALEALHQALHIARVVIVTPSFYGTDNAATLDGLKTLGPARARGVAVVGADTSAADLDALHAAGIRGVRANLETNGVTDPAAAGRNLDTVVARLGGRPWHLQVYTRLAIVDALKERFAALPMPVVFDHFAGAQGAQGVDQPGFGTVLDLVRAGKAYVKVSGAYRESERGPDYPDLAPLARALIAANPARILWGSDWPHTNSTLKPGQKATDVASPIPVDDGRLLNLLAEWAPEAATRRAILVENPARLYGFG